MARKVTLERLKDMRIAPRRDDELAGLFKAATERDAVFLLDYMSIRDLMELSGHETDHCLAAILICMFASLNEGNICTLINKSSLVKKLGCFIDKDKALYYAEGFLTTLNTNRYANLITSEKDAYIPIVRRKKGKTDTLYFKKYYEHESSLKEKIRLLLQIKSSDHEAENRHNSIIDEVVNQRPVILQDGNPMKLDLEQEKAVRLALTNNFLIISGGPGTGKTSLLLNILRCLTRNGIQSERFLISAPTGRAAQRITESIQKGLMSVRNPCAEDIGLKNVSASTIHRLLRYNPARNSFAYHSGNPLPADAVIVDEVSMVDIGLMDHLLDAIDLENTRVILLGDRDQLPSVDAGAVLAYLIPDDKMTGSMEGRFVILDKDYRSKGAIHGLAKKINKQDRKNEIEWPEPVTIFEALETAAGMCSIIKGSDQSDWTSIVKIWADHFYCKPDEAGETYLDLVKKTSLINLDDLNNQNARNVLDKIFSFLQRSKILSVIRNGIYGCTGINGFLAEYLRLKFDSYGRGERFNGAPVLVLRNDYYKELFNGDIGVMFRNLNGAYHSIFSRYGNYFSYGLDSIPSHELAFAMTVHKSQGSEFDNILIVLPEKGGDALLTREIIYTGLTRARTRAFIYGKESVLNRAVSRKIERMSGFKAGEY